MALFPPPAKLLRSEKQANEYGSRAARHHWPRVLAALMAARAECSALLLRCACGCGEIGTEGYSLVKLRFDVRLVADVLDMLDDRLARSAPDEVLDDAEKLLRAGTLGVPDDVACVPDAVQDAGAKVARKVKAS